MRNVPARARERVIVCSVGAVNKDANPPMLRFKTIHGVFDRPSSGKALSALHGFQFEAIGEVIDDPALEGPANIWLLHASEWQGTPPDGGALKMLRMAVTWPDAPLGFEREWLEGERVIDLPMIFRGGATPEEYHRMADAYQALIRFTENMRWRGRKQLRESPSSPWRTLAASARELLANGEVESIRDAAVRLGMPRYDERRPEQDGKAELAAERKLSRYLKLLTETE